MAEEWQYLARKGAEREGRSYDEFMAEVVSEALRTREHPGIYFAAEPAGRVAKLVGTGLGVWELVQSWQAAQGDAHAVLRVFPSLAAWQVEAAVRYYKHHGAEITGLIADNRRHTAESVRALLPGLIVE